MRAAKIFWRHVARLINKAFPKEGSLGRPRAPWSQVVRGILYRLHTGCQWRDLPRQYGAPTTVHGWFQKFNRVGLWQQLWRLLIKLEAGQRLVLLDASLVKAPLGGEATGPSPVHRGRLGSKRSILTERHGLPVAIVLAPANRHDAKLVKATLAASQVGVRGSVVVADRGYRGKSCASIIKAARARLVIPCQGQPSPPASVRLLRQRWRVERCFAWLNCHRALATRYDRKALNYLGMLHLAAALCWLRAA